MKAIKKRNFHPYGELKLYPEKFAVNRLLKNIEEFKNFYDNERNNISGDIFWAEDPKIERGTGGIATPLNEDGNNLIRLPIMPLPIEDAFTVAHELGHLLRKSAENNFGIGGSGNASYINSMIEDCRVDSILARYGFDLKSEYERYLRMQIPEVKYSSFFKNEIQVLTCLTNFKLRCDLVGEQFAPWQQCETVLGQNFPDLADGVRDLYQFIKENENDIHTRERKGQLLKIINAMAAKYPARSYLGTK
jgi:hypothetical protein